MKLVVSMVIVTTLAMFVVLGYERGNQAEEGTASQGRFDHEQTTSVATAPKKKTQEEGDAPALQASSGFEDDARLSETVVNDSEDFEDTTIPVLNEQSILENNAITNLISNQLYDDDKLLELLDSLDSNVSSERMIERLQYRDWLSVVANEAGSKLEPGLGIHLDRVSCGSKVCVAKFVAGDARATSGILREAIDSVQTDMPVYAVGVLPNSTNQGINMFIGTDPDIGVGIPEEF